MGTFKNRWLKLRRGRSFREEYVASQVKQSIPYQIRALMKSQGLTQQQLAEQSGLTQGAISRAANPSYGNLSVNTCVRLAAGFGVAVVVKFVPFSELDRWADNFCKEAQIPTFEEEDQSAELLFSTFDQAESPDPKAIERRQRGLQQLEQEKQQQQQRGSATLLQQPFFDFDSQRSLVMVINMPVPAQQADNHYDRQNHFTVQGQRDQYSRAA